MHAKKLHLALSICHFSCGVDIALDGDEDHNLAVERSEEEEGFSLCGTGQYQARLGVIQYAPDGMRGWWETASSCGVTAGQYDYNQSINQSINAFN